MVAGVGQMAPTCGTPCGSPGTPWLRALSVSGLLDFTHLLICSVCLLARSFARLLASDWSTGYCCILDAQSSYRPEQSALPLTPFPTKHSSAPTTPLPASQLSVCAGRQQALAEEQAAVLEAVAEVERAHLRQQDAFSLLVKQAVRGGATAGACPACCASRNACALPKCCLRCTRKVMCAACLSSSSARPALRSVVLALCPRTSLLRLVPPCVASAAATLHEFEGMSDLHRELATLRLSPADLQASLAQAAKEAEEEQRKGE